MIKVSNKGMLNGIALRQIKAGKSRNLLTIAAIALTSILVTAVLTMGAGMMDANRENLMKVTSQRSEFSFQYLLEDEVRRIAENPLVEEYGITTLVGMSDEGLWRQVPLEVKTVDEIFAELTFSTPTMGRLPQQENEVAVKAWMMDFFGLPREIGQIIPLSFYMGEDLVELDLTVSGIWEDDVHLHPYANAFISHSLGEKLLAGVNPELSREYWTYIGLIQLHGNLRGSTSDLQENLDQLVAEAGLDPEITYPRINYAFENTALGLQALASILLLLLIVVISGYLLIYNIFYISVIHDIKYYGLLKTIGTTGKQIKRIVHTQAFFLCLIGIPIGLILGYFLGVALLPLALAPTGYDTSMVTGMIRPNPLFLGIAGLLSLITVFISCRYPAKVAGKISPIEATRYTGTATGKKNVKKGYNGAKVSSMAFANLFRNKRKIIITIASVSFGLILFNMVFTFTNSFDMNRMLRNYLFGDFLVADGSYFNMGRHYHPNQALTPETVEKLAHLEGVSEVAKVYFRYNSGIPEEIQSIIDGNNNAVVEEFVREPDQVLYGLDEYWLDIIEENIIEGTFDREKFLSGNYVLIGEDRGEVYPGPGWLEVGDSVSLKIGGESQVSEYEVMAKLNADNLSALTAHFIPGYGYEAYLPASELAGVEGVDLMSATVFAQDGADLDALREEIGTLLESEPLLDFRSRSDYVAELDGMQSQMGFVGLALCLVILMIGLLNFVNTTLTNILSRKYEFSMLEALGMTIKQAKKMLILEGLYFVLIVALVFTTLGYGLSYVVVRMLTNGTAAYTYRFTLLPFFASFPPLILIAVLLPGRFYKILSKNSVVERLREVE